MGFQVYVGGVAELDRVRRALRAVDDKTLLQRMERGLKDALKPLPAAVRAEAGTVMPSGYAPVLTRSLRFRQQTRSATGFTQVTMRVFGDGRQERRDVPTLNKGALRHPVYGRKRRLKSGTVVNRPWVAQQVRPGFVDRPVDRLRPQVARQMDAVVDEIARQITRG